MYLNQENSVRGIVFCFENSSMSLKCKLIKLQYYKNTYRIIQKKNKLVSNVYIIDINSK